MITIKNNQGREFSIPLSEIEFSAVRASGPGGQHVNKTSSAVLLRLNIESSSLPFFLKSKLFKMSDHRITSSGEIIIKPFGVVFRIPNMLKVMFEGLLEGSGISI